MTLTLVLDATDATDVMVHGCLLAPMAPSAAAKLKAEIVQFRKLTSVQAPVKIERFEVRSVTL